MKTFGNQAYNFFTGMCPDFKLPGGIELLLPYENAETKKTVKAFFQKYYNDNEERIFILGINPGRFGAGITGIAFTDPVNLENECGIKNTLPKKPELSSSFIYKMILKSGGVKSFYNKYFLAAVCPIGFIKDGKNINYYDDKKLADSSRDFIIESMHKQISFGTNRNVAICLGEGKNYSYLNNLNKERNFFKDIIPLPHPRFIMQYRRKKSENYMDEYISVLTKSLEKK